MLQRDQDAKGAEVTGCAGCSVQRKQGAGCSVQDAGSVVRRGCRMQSNALVINPL